MLPCKKTWQHMLMIIQLQPALGQLEQGLYSFPSLGYYMVVTNRFVSKVIFQHGKYKKFLYTFVKLSVGTKQHNSSSSRMYCTQYWL